MIKFKTTMHELSIALGIVDIAEKEVRKANAKTVEEIILQIGTLSGIEPDALEFIWPSAVEGTVLEQARRNIQYIEGKARCLECDTTFPLQQAFDNCPACGSYFKEVLQGKELKVKSLVLEI